jgi:hypothetical protein
MSNTYPNGGNIYPNPTSGGGGGATADATYITKLNEIVALPNSLPLSSLASGLLANTTGTGDLNPVTLTGTINQITVSGGDGSSTPTFSLSSTLIFPGTITLGGALNTAGNTISQDSGSMNLTAPSSIDLITPFASMNGLRHYGESTNKILFGTGIQQFLPDNFLQFQISANGINLASGPTVNSITTSSTSTSTTALMTANTIQSAIASAIVSGKSFRGGWDASGGLYPATGGSGVGGAINMGDWWYITIGGTVGTNPVQPGDQIYALQDIPGQIDANWLVVISKVDSVFGRTGDVVATIGDYNFNQLSGSASLLQGGTGNTTVGATGTFAYSDGTKYVFSAMAVPLIAGTAGTYWRSNGTAVLSSTIQAADVPTLNQNTTGQAGSVANAATFNNSGTGDASGSAFDGSAARTISYNTFGASPLAGSSSLTTVGTLTSGVWNATPITAAYGGASYGIFVPFLANKIISGPDWDTVPFGTDTAKGICPGGVSAAQFVYHYFLYLKVGITYRFSFSALKFNSAGILQFSVQSSNQSVTYNTLSSVDLYSSSAGVVSINKQTFTFSPSGFNAGDWVECTFVYSCSTKNVSSSGYFAPVIDGNAGFSFYEKYS